ncbi:MAG: hypothetical protein CVU07_12730 [Bacteroidetes bacterium HGW-Bacteroidetes-23]|nr:MAG: hypothetical protein CVU07_12730 [Bacteroidetes bacterium HGW-Bacteroidetes-23]
MVTQTGVRQAAAMAPVLGKRTIAIRRLQSECQADAQVEVLEQFKLGIMETRAPKRRTGNQFVSEQGALGEFPREYIGEYPACIHGVGSIGPYGRARTFGVDEIEVRVHQFDAGFGRERRQLVLEFLRHETIVAVDIGHIVSGDGVQRVDPGTGDAQVQVMEDRLYQIRILVPITLDKGL